MRTFLTVTLGLCASQMLLMASGRLFTRQQQCESATNDADYAACAMQAAIGGSSIVPKLLPKFSPQASLAVKYGNVVLGGAQQLSPSKVFSQPSLSLSFISQNLQNFHQSYCVMGLRFQQPSNVKLFWLQTSLTVDRDSGAMKSNIAPAVPYISPNPAAGTGSNEYVFFVIGEVDYEAFIKQDPQWVAKSITALDISAFASTISSRVISASYFKSTFDGLPINGRSPSDLAATQSIPVSPLTQPTASTQQGSSAATHVTTTSKNVQTPSEKSQALPPASCKKHQ